MRYYGRKGINLNTRKINLNQLMILMVMFLIGGSTLANVGRYVGQNIWIVLLCGSFLGSILFTIHYRISKLHQHKGLPDILRDCFGKWFGSFLMIVYSGYFFFRTILLGNGMSEMASQTLMLGTPHRLIALMLLITVIVGSLYGLNVVGRSSEIFFFITLIALIPFFDAFFSREIFKYQNLMPLLENGITGIQRDVFRVFLFPYGDLVIFLMFFQFISKKQRQNILKRSYIAIAIATLLMITINTITVAILGSSLVQNLAHPFYNAMELAAGNNFLDRIDSLAVIIVVVTTYFKLVLYFYTTILMIQSLSKKFNFKWVLWLNALVIFIVSPYIRLNQPDVLLNTIPFKVLPIFNLVIPILIWIISEIKYRKRKLPSK